MTPDTGRNPGLPIWTYGYALTPPIARDRMGPMLTLLDDGHTQARRVSRTWESRLVSVDDVTHILVVCDTPDRHLGINRLLEAELTRLKAPFVVTGPVLIQGGSHPETPAPSDP
ncbi:MAG: hypothetical protein EA350_08315 [Gemmatimonadales bacterium]|nr:MAG: hypothetical protein EA350_08315 [Gemmatimonadales bacterium]